MWDGPPKDVEGECNATLEISDDYGDNIATIRCNLDFDHRDLHKFVCDRFTITWEHDDRIEE